MFNARAVLGCVSALRHAHDVLGAAAFDFGSLDLCGVGNDDRAGCDADKGGGDTDQGQQGLRIKTHCDGLQGISYNVDKSLVDSRNSA